MERQRNEEDPKWRLLSRYDRAYLYLKYVIEKKVQKEGENYVRIPDEEEGHVIVLCWQKSASVHDAKETNMPCGFQVDILAHDLRALETHFLENCIA